MAHNSRRFRTCLLLGVLLVAATSSGCVLAMAGAAAAGAGGVAYARGDMDASYPYPIDVVWAASANALAEAGMAISHQSRDGISGRIEAYTAAGDRVKIVMVDQGSVTALNLRVNTFGNKPLSGGILQHINGHLAGVQPIGPPIASTSAPLSSRPPSLPGAW
jgi:hypothetical protein